MSRTVALDVHKRFAEVAVHEHGQVRRVGRIQVKELDAFAASLGVDDHVVLEATSHTWAIAGLLSQHAGRVTVSNPMRTRAIASAKVKTDKIDARVLAQLAAADFLPEVWTPDEQTQMLRRRVAHRAALVRQRTRLRNQVHAVLGRNLVELDVTDVFGRRGRRLLDELELPADEREQLDASLRVHDALQVEIDRAERALSQIALEEPRARRLMTIPGVGAVTALSLVSVIGDIERFDSAAQLVGYLGLDPRVRQSGERPARHGHISREGQAHARGLLIEAAHAAIRTPGPLRAFHERVRARRGAKVALCATARKLAVICWHLLTNEEDYRYQAPSATRRKLRAVQLRAGHSTPVSLAGERAARAHELELLTAVENSYRALVNERRERPDGRPSPPTHA